LKIALVHKRLDLNGGTERDLFTTAEGLRDRGHDVHLFCSEFGVPAPFGVSAHWIPVPPLGRSIRLWSFATIAAGVVKRAGCDLVVSFGRMFDQDVLRSGGGTHRGFLKRLEKDGGADRRIRQSLSTYHRGLLALERRQFQSPRLKKIIAVSDEVKRDIVLHYSVPPEKILVLYNGVDWQRFHPKWRDEFRTALRQRWSIPLDAPLVLFVGSGFLRKGLDRLISVWNSPRFADVYLLIVGNDTRLERYREWADVIAPGRIVFAGWQNEVERYYGASDVVALPALQEGFGNVVLEGLASGVPVLVSRDVGAAVLLRGCLSHGIVDRPDDVAELAEKLLSLLAMAKDTAFQRAAREVGEEHSWERHFEQLDVVLRQACGTPGKTRVS
jgi:UDP-glucose:(heptosyl)LPS alpha-1,3-glucosyltransferase